MRIAVLLLLAASASGSYYLPPTTQRRFVLAETWELKGKKLTLTHEKKKYAYEVDLFWLADRHHSHAICIGGQYEKASKQYLKGLPRKTSLIVELVTTKKRKKLFAVGAWSHDKDTFVRVKAGGTPHLMPYEKAVKLKDRKAFAKVLVKRSADDWAAIAKPKAKK